MQKSELLQVLQKIEEAKSYFDTDKIDSEKLKIAESILKELLNTYKSEYIETETVKYMEFENILEYMTTIHSFCFDKNVEWTDFPVATIYYYLQYIAFEKRDFESFFKYAERAFNYAPLSLSSQFEIAEAYKQSGNLSAFKAETFKIYNNIFSTKNLARFYRNLGYYYVDKKYWEIAFALYILSLQYEESIMAIKELDYIKKASNNHNLQLTRSQIEQLLDDFNIPKSISSKNMELLELIYEHEEEIKNKFPEFNQEISLRLLELTNDKKYMLYNKFHNNDLKIFFSTPFIWRKLSQEEINASLSKDTIYAFQINNSLIEIKKGNKLGEFSFDDACNLNIFNNEKMGYNYVSNTTLELSLKSGTKKFRKYLFTPVSSNIYVVEYLTILNGFFIKFITTANKYDSVENFNNQQNILAIMSLLLSIEEEKDPLKNKDSFAIQTIKINDKLYQFKIPELCPNIKQESEYIYKIGEDISLYITSQTQETLIDCAKNWINSTQIPKGFIFINEIQQSKIGKHQTLKCFAQKQGYATKAYRFILINKTLLTFVHDHKNTTANNLIKEIIGSLNLKPED